MSMNRSGIAFAVLLCSVCGVSVAQEAQGSPEDTGPWSGSIALGFLSSSGNTDDSSATADIAAGYQTGAWNHLFKGKAYGASKDDETTAEAYQLGLKSTYDLNEFNYLYGALDWNKDRFAGYTEQFYQTLGYGRRVINTATLELNLEIGAGLAQQKRAPEVPGGAEPKERGSQANLGGDLKWNITENASFQQTLYIFTASDNTFWESVSKLRAGLIGNVGLALSYTIKQNSDVPAGTNKTDRYTAISLDYSF